MRSALDVVRPAGEAPQRQAAQLVAAHILRQQVPTFAAAEREVPVAGEDRPVVLGIEHGSSWLWLRNDKQAVCRHGC